MKNMRKKILGMVLTGVMAFALAACGQSQEGSTTAESEDTTASEVTTSEAETEASDAATSATAADDTASAATPSSGSGKVLVVYYSASGNTRAVAEKIAADTGADTFEIQPKDPYTDADLDWTDDSSRVNKEHNDTSLQDQVELESTEVPDWSSYTTVFIGYPIWWGGAAWPVNQFVTSNDFSEKTVIPFCTSVSSDIGSSGTDLGEKAGTGDWQRGQRFSGGASDDEVSEWINSLDIR